MRHMHLDENFLGETLYCIGQHYAMPVICFSHSLYITGLLFAKGSPVIRLSISLNIPDYFLSLLVFLLLCSFTTRVHTCTTSCSESCSDTDQL